MANPGNTSDGTKPPAKATKARATSVKKPVIELPQSMSVRQLAEILHLGNIDVIKQLMRNGIMANINQIIDYEAAAAVVAGFGLESRMQPVTEKHLAAIGKMKRHQKLQDEQLGGLQPRSPVVTVMGHVNHGKTRLLDAIRKTNVMAAEAGGITQHIGAYQVEIGGQKITFLDTPGHQAFTAMRARGAQVTDITVLVVAADDGVMPQTLEAIDHARAAGVPIVVAINKVDKSNANPDMVKQQLGDNGLVIEEWGGDVVCVPISAKEGTGIEELLEHLLVVAEMEELVANPSRPAVGVVIEAKLDKTRGSLATVLVHSGSLKLGDTVVVGTTWGRVKAMFNDIGKRVRKAGPATPVELLGLNDVPEVGDNLSVVPTEQQARSLVQEVREQREREATPQSVSLTNIYDRISAGEVKELNIILKTDVQGSIEPIKASLEQLDSDEVKVRIIHTDSGNITESDVMLAIASRGLIIGFATGCEGGAKKLAEMNRIDIRYYDVIYALIDDVDKALKGMLAPTYIEVVDGRAEVRAVFAHGRKGKVAGVYVTEGKVTRAVPVRVLRGGEVLYESKVGSLRRFKDDVKEVATGYECGVGVDGFQNIKEGDVLEFFRREKAG